MKKIKLELHLKDLQLISTNEMYIPRPTRKHGAYLTKSPKYRKFEPSINEQLDKLDKDKLNKFINELNNDKQKAIRFIATFKIPQKKFFRSDCSNYIKAIEDCIKNKIGIDDSRNCEVLLNKVISENDTWDTDIILEIYDLDFEVPDKWSKKIIK